jgi:hypothetical protein
MPKLDVPIQKTVILKYKGWFGICPVYYDDPYNNVAPLIIERHALLLPLFIFSEWMYGIAAFVGTALDPEFEPNWPLRITAKLGQPIERTLTITHED